MGSGSGKFADSGNPHHPQLVDAEDVPPATRVAHSPVDALVKEGGTSHTTARNDFQQMLAAEREKAEREWRYSRRRQHVVWSECPEQRGYSLQKVIL